MRVYIAGPIGAGKTDKHKFIKSLQNCQAGIKASIEVLLAGHDPFCPFIDFLFFLLDSDNRISEARIKRYSISWLKKCDAMIVLDGWENSPGTRDEMRVAKANGITIYHGVEALLSRNG